MLPPTKDLTDKILLEKAIKFGINKKVAEGLLRNNQHKSLTQMIEKRIAVKTDEMLKKSGQIFKRLDRNSKKSKTTNSKRETLLRNQKFELKVLKKHFRDEAEKLNKRGAPLPIQMELMELKPNRLLTSAEIKSIEKNAQRKLKRYFLDVERGVQHLPDRVSSGVSMNNSGYTPDSSESSINSEKKGSTTCCGNYSETPLQFQY